MDKQNIIQWACEYVQTAEANRIQKDYAISEELSGVRMYAEPQLAFGSAADPLFDQLKEPDAIGPFHLSPKEWLPDARTVVSVFLPFTDEVKNSNRGGARPSSLWLHARFEGQKFINTFTAHMQDILIQAGMQAVIPLQDKRFWTKAGNLVGPYTNTPDIHEDYVSNWSERHVSYICGMGTFGLSRGLITSRGVAGRLTSIVTEADFAPDVRAYTDLYEYCSKCGACARRCPANAISLESGKAHPPCSAYLDQILELCRPRYACGKCQAGVPCESGIPFKKK